MRRARFSTLLACTWIPLPAMLQETAKLLASDAETLDRLGWSVAVGGDTALVGANRDDTPAGVDAGSVYIFVRTGTSWSELARLAPLDAAAGRQFGYAVALRGDSAVISASDNDLPSMDAAYVFVRSGTAWSQQAKLVASGGAPQDGFGRSAAVDGDTVAVGAHLDDDAGSNSGSAYVFVRSGTAWSQQAKLVAADAAFGDRFGTAIALEGDTIVVGSPGDNSFFGSAYVFVRSGTTWSQEAKLVAADAGQADFFGSSVALQGDTALIGAYGDTTGAGFKAGSAYVFVRSGTSWSESQKLVAADSTDRDEFGSSVALDGDRAVIAAYNDDDAGFEAGSAYVFVRSGTSWSQMLKLIASDTTVGDRFGTSVAVEGDAVVIGAHRDDTVAGADAGSAYVFAVGFESFCDAADGSHASCPCGNVGNPDSGCDIEQGTGGVRLDVAAQGFLPQNRATLVGTGYPPASAPSAVVIRAASLDSAAPVVFGDGLRCIGTPLVRLGASIATGGTSVHAIGHGAAAGTFYYQLWFRNQPAMFCTPDAFNLSNGRTLAW